KILNNDIRFRDEFPGERRGFVLLEIERDVEDLVIEQGIRSAALKTLLVIFERRVMHAEAIRHRVRFDANDFRAMLAQVLPDKRAGRKHRKLQGANSVECTRAQMTLSSRSCAIFDSVIPSSSR